MRIGADVLIIAHQYLPSDPRVRKQIDALADHGLEGDVVCLRGADEAPIGSYRGFRLHRLPIGRHRGAGLRTYLLEYAAFLALAAWRAGRLHIRRRHPVVITHTLPDPLVFAALIPRLNGARVVMDMHEFTPELFATRYGMSSSHPFIRLMAALEQASCAFADDVITVHHPGVDMLAERGVARRKLSVVMNTAAMAGHGPAGSDARARRPGPYRLVYHGTLVNQYDMGTALDALELLAREGDSDTILSVIGAGPGLEEIRARASVEPLRHMVELHEPIPLDRIPAFLRSCDAGLVPMHDVPYSHVALPMKVLECVAEGLPVITNRSRVLEHYFGEDALLFVPFGDARALAQAIRRLKGDVALRQRLVSQSWLAIWPLRWEEQARDMARIAGANV